MQSLAQHSDGFNYIGLGFAKCSNRRLARYRSRDVGARGTVAHSHQWDCS